MLKSLFPPFASFGPLFMVMGHAFPNRGDLASLIGVFMGLAGALMTSLALTTLYWQWESRQSSEEVTSSPSGSKS